MRDRTLKGLFIPLNMLFILFIPSLLWQIEGRMKREGTIYLIDTKQ